jgi:hypothetical protein
VADPARLAFFLYVLFAAVFLGALVAMLYVFLNWKTIGSRLLDTWSKVAVEMTTTAVMYGSLAVTFAATEDKPVWWRTAVTGAWCLCAMKLLQHLVDYRVKTAEAEQKKEVANWKEQIEDANRKLTVASSLLGVLYKAVGEKVRRLKKGIEQRGKNHPKLTYVKSALTPRPHLDDLLNALAAYFRAQLPELEQQTKRFRVGVYVAKDGVMTPIHGISTHDPGYNPFTSFRKHQDNFRLNATNPAHVVQVVRKHTSIVVEDCIKAEAEGAFFFYSPEQKTYLRSMVSYELGGVNLDCATIGEAALVVDTDVPGFFKPDDSDQIQYVLKEFGVRIKLELLLQVLVERRGLADERQSIAGKPGG